MKKTKKFAGIFLAVAIAAATSLPALAVDNDFGSSAVTEDGTYTIEEMLTYAIQDEYMALAEYDKIIETFGQQRPFTNIREAEQTHIAALLPLFEEYGIAVPENTADEYIVLPDTLLSALKTGVEAEINNIGMYETFLSQDLPDDIQTVFASLMKASQNHLSAFERSVDRQENGFLRSNNRRGTK